MSAVVDFVEDVAGAVVDAVEWVGETASNVVEAAMDDPLKAAAQIAVIAATGGTGAGFLGLSAPISAMTASTALAAIEGIDVLEEGGSVEDALKGAATTFAVSQGVNFAVNSFGTPGVQPSVGETTQFWDDGSSIQWFDDGSSIITDSAGSISATPATDLPMPSVGDPTGFVPSAEPPPADVVPETLPSPGTEVTPVADAGAPEITPIAGTPAGPSPGMPAEFIPPGPETLPPYEYIDDSTVVPPPAYQPPSYDFFEEPPIASQPPSAMPPYEYIDDSTVVPDEGAAEIIDRSIRGGDVPSVPDRPLTDTLMDLAQEAYTATPGWALAAGAAAAAGAMGEEQPPAGPAEEPRRTYTYGAPPTIGSTKGLEQLWSAAESIYGDKLGSMLGIPAPTAPQFQSSFQPLLGGPAGGGIASLPRSYTPMSGGQTFDVSTLTPEQIIQLQNLVDRRRGMQ